MKTKWISKVPEGEGWYWVKYRGKRGVVMCPAEVFIYDMPHPIILTARNDYIRGDRLEGMKFGPGIPIPF